MGCSKSKTCNVFETQFGTNHLGPFALTVGLLASLKQAAKEMDGKKNARVVNLSSSANSMGNVDFDDVKL